MTTSSAVRIVLATGDERLWPNAELQHTEDRVGVFSADRFVLIATYRSADVVEAYVEPEESAGRPLQDVLAEITGEGHEWTLRAPGYAGIEEYQITSALYGSRWTGSTFEELVEWERLSERGEARDADPVAAAEARLAQIRALRAEKLSKDGILADVPPAVINRALDALSPEEVQS